MADMAMSIAVLGVTFFIAGYGGLMLYIKRRNQRLRWEARYRVFD